MGTLKVDGDDEIIRRFKRKARDKYGQKRGSIKEATMALLKDWVDDEKPDWKALEGAIESEKSSVELEKELWKRVD